MRTSGELGQPLLPGPWWRRILFGLVAIAAAIAVSKRKGRERRGGSIENGVLFGPEVSLVRTLSFIN
ncbi:hypothetical protein GE061_005464 [Apolygus lucorum]|uniref:Uncharacterized protein n=1 Tax=Apolygus lucorum TaxID=248454 RepID=A0A8S9WWC3_APOLU|nr:hypothetical protein GE061_005464 [Apolygus lucorum]